MDGLGEATIGPMAVIRAIHFIATAMTAGALIFRLGVAEPALRSAPAAAPVVRRQVLLVAWIGLAVAVASGVRWLQLEAVSMSGLPFNEAMTWDVLSTVVNETQFGLVSKIRFGLAIILAVCLVFDRLALHAVDLYFPSNTRVGGSISLLKASAVLANPRCASAPP